MSDSDDFIESPPFSASLKTPVTAADQQPTTTDPLVTFMVGKGYKYNDFRHPGKFHGRFQLAEKQTFDEFMSLVVNDIELFTSSGYYKRDKQNYQTDENLVFSVEHEQIYFRVPHKKVTMRLFSCGHDNHIQLKPVATGSRKRKSFGTKKGTCTSCIRGTLFINTATEEQLVLVTCNLKHDDHIPIGTDQRMRNEVVKLVRGYHKEARGPLTIPQVKKRLQCDLIFQYGEKVYNENRGLNPTKKDLENLLQKLNKTQGATKNDQKFLMALTEELEVEGHFVYYQAYQSVKDNQEEQDFVFVFLGKEYKHILESFGSRTLMDATYKTCRYRFNLFNVMIKTPQKYLVVGFFITQNEQNETIEFCLRKLKEWAPLWNPLVFLMDQDSAEMIAVGSVFPSAYVSLCDFHIKADWQKRFKSLGEVAADLLYHKMVKLVYAATPNPTEDVARDFYFQQEKEKMWAQCYRNLHPTGGITTTNAVEGYHSNLKTYYLTKPGILVTKLVETLVNQVFEEQLKDYREIVKLCSKNHRRLTEFPELSDCSPEVISHLKQRMNEADSCPFNQQENGSFYCRSKAENFCYVVTLTADKVWCNCPDFSQHRLPCKHLLSVAKKKLGNFPLVYQQAVEFNCTIQLKGEYCASVVDITELMQRRSEIENPDTPDTGTAANSCIADIGTAADINTTVESCTVVDTQVADSTPEAQGSTDFEDSEPGPSEVDLIPTRTEFNRSAAIKRDRLLMSQKLKNLTSAVFNIPPEKIKEMKTKLFEFAEEFEREAVDSLQNEEMPLALEFSDPSKIETKSRGRPRASGKERKKLKKQ